jgi:hypothetical protein
LIKVNSEAIKSQVFSVGIFLITQFLYVLQISSEFLFLLSLSLSLPSSPFLLTPSSPSSLSFSCSTWDQNQGLARGSISYWVSIGSFGAFRYLCISSYLIGWRTVSVRLVIMSLLPILILIIWVIFPWG